MLLPTKRGTLAACRGVALYPPLEIMKNENEQGNQNQQPDHEDVVPYKKGANWRNPLSVAWATGLNSLRIPSPQVSKLQ